MEIFYYVSPNGNFGDDLNKWLWDAILPGWRDWAPDVTLVGVGTLINSTGLESFRNKKVLVLGSGVGYGQTPDPELCAGWDIRFVRGPHSAMALGLERARAICDPAVLLPDLPDFQSIPPSGDVIFIPHHRSVQRHDWPAVCRAAGIEFVSPCHDAHDVIRKIAGARRVIAESMHAAIIADAFRVPWVPIRMWEYFHESKWADWAASLEFSVTVQPLFPRISGVTSMIPMDMFPRSRIALQRRVERISIVRALRSHAFSEAAMLSDGQILARQKALMWQVLDEVADHYGKASAKEGQET